MGVPPLEEGICGASVVANHEAPEQRRLSASECDSTKGQIGPLGPLPYENGEMGLGFVLEEGCRNGKGTEE